MFTFKSLKNLFVRHWRIFLFELILIFIATTAFVVLNFEGNMVSIALIVEDAKKDKSIGKDTAEALGLLYQERVNKYGGIHEKTFNVIVYEHKNNPDKARQIAQTIVAENEVVAVIGSYNDEMTKITHRILHEAKIPTLSPISNKNTNNRWGFQVSPLIEDYGVYMAYYIHKALSKNKVSIIYAPEKDSLDLVEKFTTTFNQLEGTVENKFIINDNVDEIINSLNKEDNEDRVLLLATTSKKVTDLIVKLKRKHIKIEIMTIDNNINKKFNHYYEEKLKSGFFSNGIYTPSLLLLDSINKPSLALVKKDYDLKNTGNISNTAMLSVLSASFVVSGLNSIDTNEFNKMDITSVRKHLKDSLRSNNWFNKQRTGLVSQLFIGLFKDEHLISAPINPTLFSYGHLSDFHYDTNMDKVVKIKDNILYLTSFVYTAIAMNKISDIDFDNLTYSLDFFLWFNFKEDVKDADNIEFLNTLEPLTLKEILSKSTHVKEKESNFKIKAHLVEDYTLNGQTYRRYHIKGVFKTDSFKNYALGQQNLYVKFRHNNKNLYKLNYVSDFIHSNSGVFNQEKGKSNNNLIDNDSLMLNYNVAYLSTSKKTMLGSPKSFNESREFSQFIAEYRLKSSLWSFRGIASSVSTYFSGREDRIDLSLMILLLSINFGVFVFTIYTKHVKAFDATSNWWWILQLAMISFILLFGELVFSQFLYDLKYSEWGSHNKNFIGVLMLYMQYTIAILWWIIPAYYITSAFEQFLWRPIEKRTKIEIPHVLRMFITFMVYLFTVMGILTFVLEVTITGLAATSGLIAIVFAVASKVDLSNVIAGLGISLARPFHLGDWVIIEDVEGQVIEMSARSTKIRTLDSSVTVIPNTLVSGSIIKNYNRPISICLSSVKLELLPIYPLDKVEKTLFRAVFLTKGVLSDPKPAVMFTGLGKLGHLFEIEFFVENFENRDDITQAVWHQIWQQLEKEDIKVALLQPENISISV